MLSWNGNDIMFAYYEDNNHSAKKNALYEYICHYVIKFWSST